MMGISYRKRTTTSKNGNRKTVVNKTYSKKNGLRSSSSMVVKSGNTRSTYNWRGGKLKRYTVNYKVGSGLFNFKFFGDSKSGSSKSAKSSKGFNYDDMYQGPMGFNREDEEKFSLDNAFYRWPLIILILFFIFILRACIN